MSSFKNEQKLEDMVDIMLSLQRYCPTVSTEEEVEVLGIKEPVQVTLDQFHGIILGTVKNKVVAT